MFIFFFSARFQYEVTVSNVILIRYDKVIPAPFVYNVGAAAKIVKGVSHLVGHSFVLAINFGENEKNNLSPRISTLIFLKDMETRRSQYLKTGLT